jgi:hypothetical protein
LMVCMMYSGPKLWNELPFSIRQASSHNAFKTKIKSLILNDDVLIDIFRHTL